jgi:hypothetical protein
LLRANKVAVEEEGVEVVDKTDMSAFSKYMEK